MEIAKKLRFQAPFRQCLPLLLNFFGPKKGGMPSPDGKMPAPNGKVPPMHEPMPPRPRRSTAPCPAASDSSFGLLKLTRQYETIFAPKTRKIGLNISISARFSLFFADFPGKIHSFYVHFRKNASILSEFEPQGSRPQGCRDQNRRDRQVRLPSILRNSPVSTRITG